MFAQPPSFSELLSRIKLEDNLQSKSDSPRAYGVSIPDNWLQGRTTYGGLSAAICLRAAQLEHASLPPLRSAQINFIGPVSGTTTTTITTLRQGKSVTCIAADMYSEHGLATHATFVFGHSRDSRLAADFTQPPKVPSFADSPDFFQSPQRPEFAKHFECQLAQGGHPLTGSREHEHYIWVRHKDREATGTTALIGIADMPPPAVLPMFKEFAPISSVNWTMNFLSHDLTTQDGWWLMRSAAEHVRDGYSSQDMQVWNSDGKLIISAMQNVAIFY